MLVLEIPGVALEPCQLKIKQFSLDILKFHPKHKDNPFTLNCSMVPRTFLFIFHAGSRRLGSNNFRNSSYKEKTAGSARVSRLSFCFLWLWLYEDAMVFRVFIFIFCLEPALRNITWMRETSATVVVFFPKKSFWKLLDYNCSEAAA